MQITSNYGGDAASNAKHEDFKLPPGVERGDDGKLVDNRPFYQTRLTGNESLASLQEKQDKADSAKGEQEAYSWNPLTMVKNTLSWILDSFKSLFFCFGAKDDAADEAEVTKREEPKAKEA